MKLEGEAIEPSRLTAVLASQRHSHFRHAIDRLLYRLKPFMRAYPINEDNEMPEHDMEWVTGIDGGPDVQIVNAIKACPALWAHAIPQDVCIVSRMSLLKFGLSKGVVDYLAMEGAAMVETRAAHHLHELEFEGER